MQSRGFLLILGRQGVFPDDFMVIMKAVYKKLFRVYAHVYHHHVDEFIREKAEVYLNTSFKVFGLFVDESDGFFDLLQLGHTASVFIKCRGRGKRRFLYASVSRPAGI